MSPFRLYISPLSPSWTSSRVDKKTALDDIVLSDAVHRGMETGVPGLSGSGFVTVAHVFSARAPKLAVLLHVDAASSQRIE